MTPVRAHLRAPARKPANYRKTHIALRAEMLKRQEEEVFNDFAADMAEWVLEQQL